VPSPQRHSRKIHQLPTFLVINDLFPRSRAGCVGPVNGSRKVFSGCPWTKIVVKFAEMATGKHVIFLGAGASKNSGYPLANDLRLLISSRNKWHNALQKYEEESKHTAISPMGLTYWDQHKDALGLFRNGGFATLDEFCKLAGSQFQSEINNLRSVVRAALGVFNPEDHFEKSEYYGFVQSLFEADLVSLRKDVTVLTYNYDRKRHPKLSITHISFRQ